MRNFLDFWQHSWPCKEIPAHSESPELPSRKVVGGAGLQVAQLVRLLAGSAVAELDPDLGPEPPSDDLLVHHLARGRVPRRSLCGQSGNVGWVGERRNVKAHFAWSFSAYIYTLMSSEHSFK